MVSIRSNCPICNVANEFTCEDDYWHCRDGLLARTCQLNGCITRERAIAKVLFDLRPRESLNDLVIYECSPAMRGLSLWLSKNCNLYHPTGYFPKYKMGQMVNGIKNENLESLTLSSESVDVWLHLDVLEHLYSPFVALAEIYRTLRKGGICLFSAPTYTDRFASEQVAYIDEDGNIKIKGAPEYHGNPQRPEDGALVTWRYGYDLPLLIQRETDFNVEVRRWQDNNSAILGPMTEIYILRK